MNMNRPKFFRGRPIIQPGETYDIDGVLFKVVTATSKMIDVEGDQINMTEPLYWLDNVETNERIYMKQSVLESKFKDISALH